jgi:hypothetical protein
MKVVTADPSRDAADVLATAGIDNADVNRLVVLGPAQFSLRNGTEQETMDAVRKAMGFGRWGGRSCPCNGPAGRSSPWRTPSAAESPWSISRGRRRWPHLRFKVMTTWRQR